MSEKRVLYIDCETHNAGLEYSMPPEKFVRLIQYAWNDGPTHLTTDLELARNLMREADYIVGHNIIAADLTWMFGTDSIEPLRMAMDRKILDTFVIASLVTPAPSVYTSASGHTYYGADKPGNAMAWLSMANLCHQFGIEGKFGDLKELAKKHNPPGTKVADLDFSLIPLDDEEFLAYAEQDVPAARNLYYYLRDQIRAKDYAWSYIWRELELASAMEQMSKNGILVNKEYAARRIEEMTADRERIMAWLVDAYGFPTTGKSPWASAKGKEVILAVLADFGITEKTRPNWPRTPKGALKLGGDDILALVEGAGDEAEEFGRAIAELKGQRSIPQLVTDCTHPDGRIHMSITSLQRSGRWSLTRPGLTVVGSREGKDGDKDLFVADEGNVLAGLDFSNADPRAMAALSGDMEYARRFLEKDPETGKDYDGHNLTGEALMGREVYYSIMLENGKPALRPVAKAAGNALNYSIGAKKLAQTLNDTVQKEKIGIDPYTVADATEMKRNFDESYPRLKRFKDRAVREGETHGFVQNSWGRKMPVDPDRAFTQAPSLYGQGTVREMMGDAILRLIHKGEYYARALRGVIHDELLLEFRSATVERDVEVARECMEATFSPEGGIPIQFPVGVGIGKTWRDAGH